MFHVIAAVILGNRQGDSHDRQTHIKKPDE